MPISTIGSNSLNQTSDLTINGVTVGKGGGSASNNTVVGNGALASNVSGVDNTAIGSVALYSNTGSTNTAVGRAALFTNSSGSSNTSVGYAALQSNTTASNNTVVGYQAGYSATIDSNSTYIGYQAGYSANYGTASAQTNTYIGYRSGYSMTTGYYNTILGAYSGNQDGLDIRTASNYIVLSDGQGKPRGVFDNGGYFLLGQTVAGLTVGSVLGPEGLIRGVRSGTTSATSTMEVYSTGASAYRFFVGMNGTIYATSTTITGISDQRLKENIVDLSDGLDAVMALKPRKFDWKEGKGKNIKGDRGFIAQEFETVFPDMIEEWKDPAPEGEEPYKGVNANLIPHLVKAIQELKTIIDAQAAEIAELKAKVA
jgi:hypothetical protein